MKLRALAIGFSILIVLSTAFVIWLKARQPDADVLSIGNLVVLSLTLIVLVWYAYDTNSIARVTLDRWKREGVLSTSYGFDLVGAKGTSGRTLVKLHNSSGLLVWARLSCNFRVYGEPVTFGELYDGERRWLLFPQQFSQGWFELETLVQMKGKTVATMISESTVANRKRQLTMAMELEFWDELGAHRRLPPRPHYFDFDRWAWIPELGEPRAS
jgi:hypothetical protein